MSSSAEPSSSRSGLWRRLAVLALAVACVGLPINHFFGYALLVIATVLIFTGEVTPRLKTWLAAAAAVAIAVLGQILLASPRIEEGHNIFLIDGPGSALESSLPADAFRFMAAEFDTQYPRQGRCDPNASGCWRNGGMPDRPFAFSADGILDGAQYSRRVSGIDFSNPIWLRLGFINDSRYNWYSGSSDIQRSTRDRRFWMGWNRWHLTMPWYVMYQFPAEFAGGVLCWQGTVLWEREGQSFDALRQANRACRTLERNDAGRRIFGVAIKPDTLAMTFTPPLQVRIQNLAKTALMLAGIGAALGLLVRWRRSRIILPFAFVALALFVIAVDDASLIGGMRPFDGGDDGLFYDGIGRNILQRLLAGDIMGALEGGEKVFYYGGPGLRYFRALEHIVFGETYLGYLSLILLLPLVAWTIFRRFLTERWALALALIFLAVPIGSLFGTTFYQYATWAARGFADPMAHILFLCGFLPIVGATRAGPGKAFAPALGGALLLALAVIMKPIVAPAAAALLGGAGLAALYQRQWRRLAGMCIGFLPVFSMALHNWVFGDVFVLFSTNAALPETQPMPPSAYVAVARELLSLNLAGEHVTRAFVHLARWLTGPSGSFTSIPLNVAAVAILVYVAARGHRFDPWLRLTAGTALAQHAVAFFYVATPRYHFLSWFLTMVVCAAWLEAAGVDWVRRRFPGFSARIAAHPLTTRLAAGLSRLQEAVGLSGAGSRPAQS